MAITVPRGKTDAVIRAIKTGLNLYLNDHPRARIDIYRQNPACVRLRVIDPDWAGKDLFDRHDVIWEYFKGIPEDVTNHLSMIVLLTPNEAKKDFANIEFEDPVPSKL